jgi:uncharacterized protein YyaL (SSP411 family)
MLQTIGSFVRVAAADTSPPQPSKATLERHLLAAEAWLCRAQDASDSGGVSYGYSIKGGWRAPYPETSGYIATTFFRLARQRDAAYTGRALRILRWLLSIQNRDGSFSNPRYGSQGIVFDTGQILFGLVRGHEVTGDAAFLHGARRAADWLVGVADADRRWTRNEHLGTPHVYNARTAWALLRMNQVEFDTTREAVARSNLDWAVAEQRPNGFFENCSFKPGVAPFTHTIAYTARGLLESGLLLGERRYLDAATRCAEATAAHVRDDGHLPSTISTAGEPASSSVCLTGNCQFAIIWMRLAAHGADAALRGAATRALDYVMSTQDLTTTDLNVHGGIKGSQPVWGRYAPMSYPNWATKFFIDAMWARAELVP